jgi:hypothetical protein
VLLAEWGVVFSAAYCLTSLTFRLYERRWSKAGESRLDFVCRIAALETAAGAS